MKQVRIWLLVAIVATALVHSTDLVQATNRKADFTVRPASNGVTEVVTTKSGKVSGTALALRPDAKS